MSLQPTKELTKEEAQSLELVAFSGTAWTSESSSTSTTCIALWGVSLTTSCKTTCANTQEEAELDAVRLALNIASHTKSFLQHLGLDQLSQLVGINLRTTSWHDVLEKGEPLALQLGLSRRNKHIQLGQLRISKVLPHKNLAHSLANNAPRQMLLAKLRIEKEAAETGALLSVFGQGLASLESRASFLVGMVALEQPPMAQLHPRQLVFLKPADSFTKSFQKRSPKSLQSLTLQSLSLEKDQSDSLTLHSWSFATYSLYLDSLSLLQDSFRSLNGMSLSFQNCNSQSLILHSFHDKRDRLCSLTLPSLSLIKRNCFTRMSFEQTSFEHGNLEELAENLAHQKLEKKAETKSFQSQSLMKAKLAQEAGTNSFKSFNQRIWSLRMCLSLLLFCSFQYFSAALILGTCFCTSSFPKQSLQEEQLEAAYQLDQYTSLSFTCFSLSQCSSSTLESFNQLDLTTSLSFPTLDSVRFSHQLQATSFDTSSFELRAFRGAASLQITRIKQNQLKSLQLQEQQLTRCFVSGGALQTRALTTTSSFSTASTLMSLSFPNQPSINISQRALRRRTLSALTWISLSLAQDAWLNLTSTALISPLQLTALTWISLSLAQDAWLKPSSLRAWKKSPLTSSLTAIFPTRAFTATSSHRSTSMRSLQTTSFRRLASASALATTSLRTTSSFQTTLSCFSFLFDNFVFNNSFATKEAEKKDELQQNFLEQELEKVLANKTCSLDLSDGHLEQNLWQIQLQELSLQQNNQKQQTQLSASVPDRKLLQLHLSQLCQQDPESAISRQLPEEPLSASGLRTAAWPAAVHSDHLSFSKQKLAEEDLSNISLEEFFPENFGKQLPEQQLQNNNFQQLSLEHPSFRKKTLQKELATTFAKTSLIDNLVFQNFFFANLALQKVASEQLGENNLYKKHLAENNFTKPAEEACKEQLLTTGFPEASLNQQPFRTSLVQQSGATAASQPELLHKELLEQELADKNFDKKTLAATSLPTRTSTRQLQKNQLEEENLAENSFEALCLTRFPGTACKEALLQHQFLHQQLSSRPFQQDSFSASSLPEESFRTTPSQPAAFRTGLSDRQLHRQQLDRKDLHRQQLDRKDLQRQQLGRRNWETSNFEKTSFAKKRFAEKSFAKKSFAATSFDKKSFAKTSFDKTSLADTSFADDSFKETTFQEESFQEDRFAETSFTKETFYHTSFEKKNFSEPSFAQSSLKKSSLDKSSFQESSLALSRFHPSSFERSSFTKSSFTKNNFDKTSSLEESSLAESSLATSTSALSSFLPSSFPNNFEKSSFDKGSFTKSSFEESSFAQSSLEESSLHSSPEQSSLEADSFEAPSFLRSSFRSTSFQKDSLKNTSLEHSSFSSNSFHSSSFSFNSFKKTSFRQNSFRNNSFQPTSFQQQSLQKHSFQQNSLNSSFQPTTSAFELSELQRKSLATTTSTSELSSLKAHTCLKTERSPSRRPNLDIGPPRGSAKESFPTLPILGSSLALETSVLALKLSTFGDQHLSLLELQTPSLRRPPLEP